MAAVRRSWAASRSRRRLRSVRPSRDLCRKLLRAGGDLGNVDPHGGAVGDQADAFRTLAAGLKQAVGHLALDGAGNIADAAVGAFLQRVDRLEQDRRIDAAGVDREAELLAERLDLERDHAGDVEPFERPEGEHAVDAREYLRRELRVAE